MTYGKIPVLNQMNAMIENEMIENAARKAEASMSQINAFNDLSDEDLEARISKDNGGAQGTWAC